MTLADVSSRYTAMFGINIDSDSKLIERSDPGTDTLAASILQSDMISRDEHLFATIEQALARCSR
jgi:hypothetical protein